MYLMLRDRELTVVGGMSTSLLTAGLLMPRVRCAALVGDGGASGDRWDLQLLDQLHISPLVDTHAIAKYFGAGHPQALSESHRRHSDANDA
jgi:hypothetical protein